MRPAFLRTIFECIHIFVAFVLFSIVGGERRGIVYFIDLRRWGIHGVIFFFSSPSYLSYAHTLGPFTQTLSLASNREGRTIKTIVAIDTGRRDTYCDLPAREIRRTRFDKPRNSYYSRYYKI